MDAKFKIGDRVFKSGYDRVETHIQCPDCGGTKQVTVVLFDGTEITIECGGCDPGGYQPSTGQIKQWQYTCIAKPLEVTGVALRRDTVEYELNNFGGGSYYTASENELFATSDEAMANAELKRAEHEAEENKRYLSKTKDEKSWAWNATYHRNCIKEAERQLAYHRSKVVICAAKAKEVSKTEGK